ncbi:MAG: tetratricopeptide repeat protein, partial [Deltaproteobacteria bacterium]
EEPVKFDSLPEDSSAGFDWVVVEKAKGDVDAPEQPAGGPSGEAAGQPELHAENKGAEAAGAASGQEPAPADENAPERARSDDGIEVQENQTNEEQSAGLERAIAEHAFSVNEPVPPMPEPAGEVYELTRKKEKSLDAKPEEIVEEMLTLMRPRPAEAAEARSAESGEERAFFESGPAPDHVEFGGAKGRWAKVVAALVLVGVILGVGGYFIYTRLRKVAEADESKTIVADAAGKGKKAAAVSGKGTVAEDKESAKKQPEGGKAGEPRPVGEGGASGAATAGSAGPDTGREKERAVEPATVPGRNQSGREKSTEGSGPAKRQERGTAAKTEPASAVAKAESSPPSEYLDLVRRGDKLFRAGRFGKAARLFEQALQKYPRGAAAMVALANCYFEMGRYRAAIKAAKEALVVDPNNPQAYLTLGTVYQTLGRTKGAVSAYRRYLKLAPRGQFASDVRAILKSLQ